MRIKLLLVLALTVAVLAGAAVSANAAIYWTVAVSINRANLDGTNVIEDFIPATFQNLGDSPVGVAVGSGYVYWYNMGTDAIERANIDGSNVNTTLITGIPDDICWGDFKIAVSGNYVYWNNGVNIGRANLDGSNVNTNLARIKGRGMTANSSCALAADKKHVYWGTNAETIVRADLNGYHKRTIVKLSSRVQSSPFAVSLVASKTSVYWSSSDGKFGRAHLNGTHAKQNFARKLSSRGYTLAATYGAYIYLIGPDMLGRAHLDGSHFTQLGVILGPPATDGLAVDGL